MMDCYLQEAMMRERKAEVERYAAMNRMLRVEHPRSRAGRLWERVARWLRHPMPPARPRPTLIPQTKSR